MSLIAPTSGEVFLVRIQSFHNLNPSQKWSNNYALYTVNDSTTAELRTAASAILSFQSLMTISSIVTERAVVSTFVPDTNPYDADEFLTIESPSPGDVVVAFTDMLPLEACLYLRKVVNTGRVGKTFLRGALSEGDVSFGQSFFSATNTTLLGARLADAVLSSNLNDYMGTNLSTFALCLPDRNGVNTGARVVQSLEIGGVRNVNMNKRYYNRV